MGESGFQTPSRDSPDFLSCLPLYLRFALKLLLIRFLGFGITVNYDSKSCHNYSV